MIPKRIVAIGTSAFFGYGDPQHGGYLGRLKIWHEGLDLENCFFNLGISGALVGETTESLLKRLVLEAKVREPDLILLTSGINDIRRFESKGNLPATSPEQFAINIHEMIKKARNLVGNVIFVSTYPLQEKHDSTGNWFLKNDNKKYAEIVKQTCKEENIPYVDVFSEWEKVGYGDLLGPDGVHANPKGHEQIYEYLKKFLIQQYNI